MPNCKVGNKGTAMIVLIWFFMILHSFQIEPAKSTVVTNYTNLVYSSILLEAANSARNIPANHLAFKLRFGVIISFQLMCGLTLVDLHFCLDYRLSSNCVNRCIYFDAWLGKVNCEWDSNQVKCMPRPDLELPHRWHDYFFWWLTKLTD